MSTDRPNIVVIVTDQHSATMMSCTGNRHLHTPAMDSIAAQGVRFERAYCSNPICLPSRFSMVTGRMPSAIDVITNDVRHLNGVPERVKKSGLGWLVREAGYDVAYAGRYHLPHMKPEDLGFDYIERDQRDRLGESCSGYIRTRHGNPFLLFASFINPHDICYMAIRDHALSAEGALETDIKIDRERIEIITLDKAMKIPDGISEEEFYSVRCPPLPPNFEVQEGEPGAIEILQKRRPFKYYVRHHYDEKRWRMHRWAYCRLVETVDRQMEPILTAIQESGQADNTVIILTSDHGDMDSAHRMEHKNALYEEACRVPLLVCQRGKMVAGGVDASHLVSNGLDLVPTICDYAGAKAPADLKGRSIRPLVEGGNGSEWRTMLPVEGEYGRMVMTDRYKYMMYFEGENREQLMDLQKDPGEMRNALNDPGNGKIAAHHRRLFAEAFQDEGNHR